jgi:hypothetical protein
MLIGPVFSRSLDSQGVAPFGEVVEGMDVVDAINAEYGGEPEVPMILKIGNRYLQKNYPNLTIITACRFDSASDSDEIMQMETAMSELKPVRESDAQDAALDVSWSPANAPMGSGEAKKSGTDTLVSFQSKPEKDPNASTPALQPGAGLNTQEACEDEVDVDIEGMLGDLDNLEIPAEVLLAELGELDIPWVTAD